MIFKTMGNVGNPVIIMLTGSFCASESMAHIYDKMKDDYFIIAPTYTGHYEGSGNFTTRQGEAACIIKYLIENNIENVHMVYGQSMGGEVAIELMKQMQENNIAIGYGVFDGAPCIKLSKAYKKFPLYYTISERGIEVEQDDAKGSNTWDNVMKIVSTKRLVIIYTSRMHAYVIPREALKDSMEEFKEIVKNHCEASYINI